MAAALPAQLEHPQDNSNLKAPVHLGLELTNRAGN